MAEALMKARHPAAFTEVQSAGVHAGPRGEPIDARAAAALVRVDAAPNKKFRSRRVLASVPRLLEGYRVHASLPAAEAAALPHAMLAYHLLLANWFLSLQQPEGIPLEIQALAWLHANFDHLSAAAADS